MMAALWGDFSLSSVLRLNGRAQKEVLTVLKILDATDNMTLELSLDVKMPSI